ncbi:MAG TPA: hypothetical protein VG406_28845 [Isosphaeraceae bacterium]|jgi:hypothetical protein|nr:hypothetical protein [Isosphaeraceae bacterium]
MRDDFIIKQMKEAMERDSRLTPEERFDRLVRRGVIDEKGRLLRHFPEPPKKKRAVKAKGDKP